MPVDLSTSERKILTVEELAKRVYALKSEGKTVVMCHGVFDLLHVGHIRHLQEARDQGDVLLVTLTADRYVNKGPDRPAFTEALRAEALAALTMVDFVAINSSPRAVELLKMIAPHVYAKGPDYRNAADDVTGGIIEEEEAVESVGGRIYYTEDVTFSSSKLINRHFSSYSQEVNDYLASLRERYSPGDFREAIERLRDLRVAVVGEAIIDEYVYVEQMGKSSKEPVLAMRYASTEHFAGGALAIANHVASFTDNVQLITFLGTGESYEEFIRSKLAPHIVPHFLYKKNSQTIVKRRYVENYLLSKLFEVYFFNDEMIDQDDEDPFCAALEAICGDVDLVIVADFGHGIMSTRAIDTIESAARFLAINTQQNAANIGYHTISKYSRADFICIQEGELRQDARTRLGPIEPLVTGISQRLGSRNMLVTQGKRGATFYREHDGWFRGPAFARSVVDRIGSGDAVLSVASPMAAQGLPGDMIVFMANVIGAQAAQIIGNRTAIDRVATLKFIEALLK